MKPRVIVAAAGLSGSASPKTVSVMPAAVASARSTSVLGSRARSSSLPWLARWYHCSTSARSVANWSSCGAPRLRYASMRMGGCRRLDSKRELPREHASSSTRPRAGWPTLGAGPATWRAGGSRGGSGGDAAQPSCASHSANPTMRARAERGTSLLRSIAPGPGRLSARSSETWLAMLPAERRSAAEPGLTRVAAPRSGPCVRRCARDRSRRKHRRKRRTPPRTQRLRAGW
jgi:hypothetical protein